MRRPITLTRAVALGAVAMYFCDPQNGKRRRTRLREKTLSFLEGIDRTVATGLCDLTGGWQKVRKGTRKVLRREEAWGEDSTHGQARERAAAGEVGETGEGGERSFLRSPLSPAARGVAGGVGGLLLFSLFSRWSLRRVALAGLGLALIARAVVNGQAGRAESAPGRDGDPRAA